MILLSLLIRDNLHFVPGSLQPEFLVRAFVFFSTRVSLLVYWRQAPKVVAHKATQYGPHSRN